MIPFLRLSCTKSHHYGTILRKSCRFFFMSKRISQHVVPTWHVVSSGMVRTTEFDDMSGRHSRHFPDMSACRRTTCHLGGSGDTTRRRHFQLSLVQKSMNSYESSKSWCTSGIYHRKFFISPTAPRRCPLVDHRLTLQNFLQTEYKSHCTSTCQRIFCHASKKFF